MVSPLSISSLTLKVDWYVVTTKHVPSQVIHHTHIKYFYQPSPARWSPHQIILLQGG